MKTRLSVDVELGYRVMDSMGSCSAPDYKKAIVEIRGTPNNWKAIRGIWAGTREPVEPYLLDGTNNKLAINEAANRAFNKQTVDTVCTA